MHEPEKQLKDGCVILYFYTIILWISYACKQEMDMFFIACRSQAEKMSNQLQIKSYRISMRKLRTFYWKVTEFLNDDKITCLQRPAAFAINGVYWRTEWCGYLCRYIECLCKKTDWTHRVCQQSSVFIFFVNAPYRYSVTPFSGWTLFKASWIL